MGSLGLAKKTVCTKGVGLLFLALVACPEGKSEPVHCPPPHAAFRLVLDALDGPLPQSTQIIMRTGSGTETFRVVEPDRSPSLLFCKTETQPLEGGPPDGQDAPSESPVARVTCELWTDGAATIRATADGYPDALLQLAATRDECGIVMTEHHLTLERRD